MAPKKKFDTPLVPPEPNPEDDLPQAVRELEEPPFAVQWQAVNSIVCLTPEIKPEKLKEALKRKDLVRTPVVYDLVLRLPQESELAALIRPSLEEHLGSGLSPESFLPSSEHAAKVLNLRFERDRCIDWKVELHRRQRALKACEEAVQAAEASSEAAQLAVTECDAALRQWEEEQEAARVAAMEKEDDGAMDSGSDEPSEVQIAHKAAAAAFEESSEALAAAKAKLETASFSMLQPFIKYQAYWVDGLGEEPEAVLLAIRSGLDLTSVVWGTPLPQVAPTPELGVLSEESGEGGGRVDVGKVNADEASAQGAAEADNSAAPEVDVPEVVFEAPPLYTVLQRSAKAPAWDDPLALLVALTVKLPPTPPEAEAPSTPASAKGKRGAKPSSSEGKKGKKGKGDEEPPPPMAVPVDAPGWEVLARLFELISEHAKTYREWRSLVTVYDGQHADEGSSSVPIAMDVYDALLQGVSQERVSVPVLVHALLEQVSANMQDDNVTKEELSGAKDWVLDALSLQIEELENGELGGSIFQLEALQPAHLSVVRRGDEVAAAAAGLTVGRVRAPATGAGAGKVGQRPDSPISTLQSVTDGSEGDEAIDGSASRTHPLLASSPRTAVLDIHAVESYMRALFLVPGVNRWCMPNDPEVDVVERETQLTKLKSHVKHDLPPAAVLRHTLLQAFTQMLPEKVVTTHEIEIMERRHLEEFPLDVLRQVVVNAQLEFPHSTCSYHAPRDCMLLAMYAGDCKRHEGEGLPITIPFATYWERATKTIEEEKEMLLPDVVYKVSPDMQEHMQNGQDIRYQFGDDGSIIATGAANGPLTIFTASTTITYSSAKRTVDADGLSTKAHGSTGAASAKAVQEVPVSSLATEDSLATEEEEGCTQLVANLEGGISVCASRVVIVHEATLVKYPTQAEVDAAMAQAKAAIASATAAAAAVAASKEAAAAAASVKPGSGKPGSGKSGSRAVTPKGKKKGGVDETAALSATELSAAAAAESAAAITAAAQALAAEFAKAPQMPPPPQPVYSVAVTLPDGSVFEMTTGGYLMMRGTVVAAACTHSHTPAARPVMVPGAPCLGGDLGQLAPQSMSSRAFTASGSLINSYEDGSIRVMHPDGSVSERVDRIEGWVALTGKPGGGWRRTMAAGQCIVEPDPTCGLQPGAGDLPRQVEQQPVTAFQSSDPDSGASTWTREDLAMQINFSTGDALLQDADGSRISTIPTHYGALSWSAECDNLPAVVSSGREMSVSPVPGITLSWSSSSRSVCCKLPDESSVVVLDNLALWVPSSQPDITAEMVAFTMASLADSDMQGDVVGLAQAPGCKGAAVFDLRSGAAALSSPIKGSGRGIGPLHFVIGPGGRELLEWVEPIQARAAAAQRSRQESESDAGETRKVSHSGSELGEARKVSHSGSVFLHGDMDADLAPAIHPRLFVIYPTGRGYELLGEAAVFEFFREAERIPGSVLRKQLLPGSEEADVLVHQVMGHLPQHTPQLAQLSLGKIVMEQRKNPRASECVSSNRPSSRQKALDPVAPFSFTQFLPRVLGLEPPSVSQPPKPPVLLHRTIVEYPTLSMAQADDLQATLGGLATAEQAQLAQKNKFEPLKDRRPADQIACDAQVLQAIMEMRHLQDSKPRQGNAGKKDRRMSTAEKFANGRVTADDHELTTRDSRTKPQRSLMGHSNSVADIDIIEGGSIGGGSISHTSHASAAKMTSEKLKPEKETRAPVVSGKAAAREATRREVEQLPDMGDDDNDDEEENYNFTFPAADQYTWSGATLPEASPRMPPRLSASSTGVHPTFNQHGVLAPIPSLVEMGHIQQHQQQHDMDEGYSAATALLQTQPPGTTSGAHQQLLYPSAHGLQGPDEFSMKDMTPLGAPNGRPTPAPLMSWAPRPAGPKFSVSPDHLHFGIVLQGSVTHSTVRLRNTGRTAASYSVVRPDLPLRIIQRPGPVAPGAEAVITVEFVASTSGNFVGEVVIHADNQEVKVSVSSKVL